MRSQETLNKPDRESLELKECSFSEFERSLARQFLWLVGLNIGFSSALSELNQKESDVDNEKRVRVIAAHGLVKRALYAKFIDIYDHGSTRMLLLAVDTVEAMREYIAEGLGTIGLEELNSPAVSMFIGTSGHRLRKKERA